MDINALTLEAIELLRKELDDHNIVAHTMLAPEMPAIQGNRGQLREVILNLQPRACRLGQLTQLLPHRLQLGWLHNRRQQRWHRIRNHPLGRTCIRRIARCPPAQDRAALLIEAREQVHAAIDDAPGEIATQRGKQHGANRHVVGGRDSERQGEAEGHD